MGHKISKLSVSVYQAGRCDRYMLKWSNSISYKIVSNLTKKLLNFKPILRWARSDSIMKLSSTFPTRSIPYSIRWLLRIHLLTVLTCLLVIKKVLKNNFLSSKSILVTAWRFPVTAVTYSRTSRELKVYPLWISLTNTVFSTGRTE